MSSPAVSVTIRILDKEYMVSCPEDERSDLIESARFLDRKMRETHDGGKVLGTERIAVMTALNLAHELLENQRNGEAMSDSMVEGIERIQSKVEAALSRRPAEEAVN